MGMWEDGLVGVGWWLKGDVGVRCLGLWVGMGRGVGGDGLWFEGDVGVGECESCHILVIDKCIISYVYKFTKTKETKKPCMSYN